MQSVNTSQNALADLRTVQEAMVRIWSNKQYFESLSLANRQTSELEKAIINSLDSKRLKLYQDDILIRRIYLVKQCFKLTWKVLADEGEGEELVNNYWNQHPSSNSNAFFELEFFPNFLHNSNAIKNYPYVVELAKYEWLRHKALFDSSAMKRARSANLFSKNDRQTMVPMLHPALVLANFNYPVHKIAGRTAANRWKEQTYKTDDHYIAIYQSLNDRKKLRVIELDEFSFMLLDYARSNRLTYEELIQYACSLLPGEDAVATATELIEMFIQFEQLDMILGSSKHIQ